jgi:hypothetical protein
MHEDYLWPNGVSYEVVFACANRSGVWEFQGCFVGQFIRELAHQALCIILCQEDRGSSVEVLLKDERQQTLVLGTTRVQVPHECNNLLNASTDKEFSAKTVRGVRLSAREKICHRLVSDLGTRESLRTNRKAINVSIQIMGGL